MSKDAYKFNLGTLMIKLYKVVLSPCVCVCTYVRVREYMCMCMFACKYVNTHKIINEYRFITYIVMMFSILKCFPHALREEQLMLDALFTKRHSTTGD